MVTLRTNLNFRKILENFRSSASHGLLMLCIFCKDPQIKIVLTNQRLGEGSTEECLQKDIFCDNRRIFAKKMMFYDPKIVS